MREFPSFQDNFTLNFSPYSNGTTQIDLIFGEQMFLQKSFFVQK